MFETGFSLHYNPRFKLGAEDQIDFYIRHVISKHQFSAAGTQMETVKKAKLTAKFKMLQTQFVYYAIYNTRYQHLNRNV
jgi:hypothetical protein